MQGIINTKPDRCKRCYGCIRECPAKAIRVVNGQAKVMDERCIACGHCVKVCTQNAKEIYSFTPFILNTLLPGYPTYAIVAPSFAASWPSDFNKIPTALRKIGFAGVIETAFGADLISSVYANEIDFQSGRTVISSSCPAVCNYIEKYFTALVPNLAKIVSPMIATGKYIKEFINPGAKVVFIGPCTAKKAEIMDEKVKGVVDAVLTFSELKKIFTDLSVTISELEESNFDPPYANTGKVYPLAGGLIKTANIKGDILEKEVIVVEGKGKVVEIIEEISNNKINAKFIDILFCEGCINGPAINSELNYYGRREKIIEFINENSRLVDKKVWQSTLYNSRNLDLHREFTPKNQRREMPQEGEIKAILQSINKHSVQEELNCGACGYDSCREFAISIAKGLGEREMCLPHVLDQIQVAYENLRTTQEQLHSAEKLASIGQLAAGIAHEINNPLGTIMLYAALIKKQIEKGKEGYLPINDLTTITNEANRCKNIVENLLNFARQGKLSLSKFDCFELITEIVRKLKPRQGFDGVEIEINQDANSLEITADKDQLEQVFSNIIINAVEAMENSIIKKLSISLRSSGGRIEIAITDTGCGIHKENSGRIFTPFYTTKKIGKGTGLGLAITYGIIKMHKGDITFESEPEKGTTFRISLPVQAVVQEN